MEYTWISWTFFNAAVAFLLFLDLAVFHRESHQIKMREALLLSLFWIGLALCFNGWIWAVSGPEDGLTFLTAYTIEKALSIDNLFVFLLIFSYFKTPAAYQHKVLFWGILGAIFFRIVFILGGIALLNHFHWVLYLFGGFLIYTGIRMLIHKDEEIEPEHNPMIRFVKRFLPVTKDYVNGYFWVKKSATPLFLVLIMIETTDIIFALDSIPAVLAITRDPFIAYTSNICAILGLRALYFALAHLADLFHHLHYALSAILAFIGAKMILADIYPIPIGWALGFVAAALTLSVISSLLTTPVARKK